MDLLPGSVGVWDLIHNVNPGPYTIHYLLYQQGSLKARCCELMSPVNYLNHHAIQHRQGWPDAMVGCLTS